MKRIYTFLGLFVFSLLFVGMVTTSYASSANDDPQYGSSMTNTEFEKASRGIMLFRMGTDPYTGMEYTHDSRYEDREITYGIDVSSHNGSIDWTKVKKDGIKYVMIRAAYRGYGSSGLLKKDTNFDTNIKGALDAGLQVGAYIFSQAITKEEAVEEADYLVNLVKGYNITLPLVIDYEYASTESGTGGRLYEANLSKSQATSICRAFCRSISQDGYMPMVYANKTMLTEHLDASELSDRYKVWLANYTTETSYKGDYDVWQYSSKGSVDGISGYVDCNFWYGESDTIYNGVDYSPVYNFEYYVSKNIDVKNAFGSDKRKTIEHFVNYGMSEGRRGSEEFNVYAYRNRYSDLKNIYGNDLKRYYLHYLNYGRSEGRSGEDSGTLTVYNGVDYSGIYDFTYYVNKYSDIKNKYGNDDNAVLWHFVNYGMSEGRRGSEEFNVYAYRNRYSDLKNTYGNDLKRYYLHYLNYGKTEGRSGKDIGSLTVYNGVDYSAVYDFSFYVNKYGDIKKAYGNNDNAVLWHFVNYGMSEGRQGSAEFNVFTYKNRYVDLRKVYGNDLKKYYLHYNTWGKKEGRTASGTSAVVNPVTVCDGVDYSDIYNYNYYINKYADIKKTYGDDDISVLRHFVDYGMSEGRQGSTEFNVFTYKNRYVDLRKVYGNDLQKYYLHYNSWGKKEGRNGSGTSKVINPITVYEGDDYSAVYDYAYYIEKYEEVKEKFGDDDLATLEYFVNVGMAKGHRASEEFDINYYKITYPDLKKVYGDDLKQYYMHYINWGKDEGRHGTQSEEGEKESLMLETVMVLQEELPEDENVDNVISEEEYLENGIFEEEEYSETFVEEPINVEDTSETIEPDRNTVSEVEDQENLEEVIQVNDILDVSGDVEGTINEEDRN